MGHLASNIPNTNDSQWDLIYKLVARTPAAPDHSAGTTGGPEASKVVAGALRCFDVVGFNTKATDQYIQIHDAAAVPSNGAVPVAVLLASAVYQFGFSWASGRVFTNGIVVVNSSTPTTLTIGSADCLFDVNYSPL